MCSGISLLSKSLWPYHSLKSRERERDKKAREIEKHSKCQPGILSRGAQKINTSQLGNLEDFP